MLVGMNGRAEGNCIGAKIEDGSQKLDGIRIAVPPRSYLLRAQDSPV